jgi:hypothetical protein
MGGLACGLALLLATSCSSGGGPDTDGPFGGTDHSSGGICVHTRPGGVAFDGFEQFPNTGGPATITKVRLVHPRNLRLVAAWVLPTSGVLEGVGVGAGYPTASGIAANGTGARWALRERIPGAVVQHTRGHHAIALVIVTKPSGKVGSSKAIDLYYESAGKHYLLNFPYGFTVKVAPTC